jgi:hypothetical protein
MTCIIFTANPQNYSILKFPPIHESQIKPSNPSKVITLQCKTTPEKDDSEVNDYLKKIIDDMFAECALPRKKVIEYEHVIKNEAVKEDLTVKELAFYIFSSFSTGCQSIGRKLKKALTPKRKESATEKRAKALQLKLNHLLDLEAITLREYVPDALYDELARLDAIIAQEKGL